jgi:transposase
VPVVVDRLTGEVRQAQIFVVVMGASNFTYVEATWTQGLGDWVGAHTRTLAAIGSVPRLIVPDNAKVAVIGLAFTSPRSIESMPRWRRMRCCRPGPVG